MTDKDPWKRRGESLRNQSLAFAIPSLFIGGPLGVGAAGFLVGRYFGHEVAGALFGVALGFFVAVRETRRILRQLSDQDGKSG